MARHKRSELARNLREITGWIDLHFDDQGVLSFDGSHDAEMPLFSPAARKLLTEAVGGTYLIVLEDASGRDDVVFSRVVDGVWRQPDDARRPPVSIVLIDFADFSHVTGDRAALEAFNVGWGVLHEVAHVVHGAHDPENEGGAGQCEALINAMRRERGLAERAEYFFSFYPGQERSEFKTRLVRLAFVTRDGVKKPARHWLMWDAQIVGGLDKHRNAVTGYRPR